MAFEIIDNNDSIATSLVAGYADEYPDMILISVHRGAIGKASDHPGLDVALQRSQEGRPIILYGCETQKWMMRDPRFVSLIEKSNIAYVREAFKRADIAAAYRNLKR